MYKVTARTIDEMTNEVRMPQQSFTIISSLTQARRSSLVMTRADAKGKCRTNNRYIYIYIYIYIYNYLYIYANDVAVKSPFVGKSATSISSIAFLS